MHIHCPFCNFDIEVKAGPGSYQPHCPQCHKQFVLAVPRQPGAKAVAAKTVEELRARAGASSHHTSASAPSDRKPPPASPRAGSNAQATMTGTGSSATAGGSGYSSGSVSPTLTGTGQTGELPTSRLDGYELIRMLGRGAMGCVYLARQVSLDRLVAVKTIDPRLSRDSAFLSRFVREAYAVAQLSHHNVVQIHDIGQADETHYFSMEYVAGRSLADQVKSHGSLDPEEAATYILHAARGLKFAHDHQMVHRDVKPSNLLLNDQGLVKVADLGLVKTPGGKEPEPAARSGSALSGGSSSNTSAGGAIGTPAYMSPEQARDPAAVDDRADVYSLGATFYHLLTGRPPFEGESTEIVIHQHATATLVPPERMVSRVPQTLSAMVQKMLAKKPDERYQNMGEVVAALEGHLGIEAGPFTPRREHASALELAVASFNKAPAARWRSALILAGNLLVLLAVVIGAFRGNLSLIGAALGLWISSVVTYQLIGGLFTRSILIRRARQYMFSISLKHWIMLLGGAAVFIAMLLALGLLWLYVGTLIVGVCLAAGFYFGIDKWMSMQRQPHVEGIRRMLKDMRLRGLEEEALHRFVCRYAGKHWEAFYEALFGYEAKMDARRHWGHDLDGRPRPRYAGWRDGLIEWFDLHLRQREEARQRHYLQRVELRRLQAEGVSDMQAAAEARRAVSDLITNRPQPRPRKVEKAQATTPDLTAAQAFSEEAPPEETHKLKAVPLSTRLMILLFGARGRLLAGVVLLAVAALWAKQNPNVTRVFPEKGHYLAQLRDYLLRVEHVPPLSIPPVPQPIWQVLCTPTAALAGLILLLSIIFRGRRMTFFLLPVIILLLRAPFMATEGGFIMSPREWTIVIALTFTLPALFFGRSEYD
ncbi:MAG: protein kinase [Phycisphaeraceae bacterium]|nr:protein kinase [Phycisphaeraceae bacterium]